MRAHPTFCAQVNRDALALYLRQMAVPGTHSIYQGIQKLSPGTFLTVSRARPQPVIKPYWSASEIAERGIAAPYKGKADGAINRLEALLKDAVRGQMMADVPLGAFLSGGVDSSTVVALMQAQSTRAVKTFSIGFHEEEFNEAEHAKAVARHLGTEHTELYVTSKQAMDVIPKLPALYDEPFADSSQIPTYLVSELARQHVTVSLSGDGGDELFCGYRRYTDTARLWSRLSILPVPLRKTIAQIVRTVSPSALNWVGKQIGSDSRWARLGDRLHKGAEVITCSSLEALYMGMVSNWHESEMEVIRDHKHSTPLTSLHTELSGMSGIERMMALDLVTYLADDILTKVDRAGMGVSLETRVPLLDHRVVEFAWSLPLHYKLRPEGNAVTSKWALRQVLYRHVPQVLIERPKMGFGVPIDAWLRGPLRDWAEDLLDESRLRREGFFNPEPIRKKWREHLSGHRNWRNQLWAILMFQAWLENTRRV
jgi:asparagine synthase (glutamine-hydrolysing)